MKNLKHKIILSNPVSTHDLLWSNDVNIVWTIDVTFVHVWTIDVNIVYVYKSLIWTSYMYEPVMWIS